MLLVDYRSGSKELIEPLRRMGLTVDETDLHSGDIAFIGRGEKGVPIWIGIEFKTLTELMQSMRTGRLTGHQLLKMQDDFRFKYLFIEGLLRMNEHGQLLRRSGRGTWKPMPGALPISELFKRLFSLTMGTGTLWSIFDNRALTLRAIVDLYRTWTDKDQDQHRSHLAMYDPPPIVPINQQRQMLCKLPGVNVKGSKALLGQFGSVRNVCNASAKQIADVETVDDHGKTRRLGDAAGLRMEQFVTELVGEAADVRRQKRR